MMIFLIYTPSMYIYFNGFIFVVVLVIGAFNNTRTLIRRKDRILIDLHTPNVLRGDKPMKIRIKITEGKC